MKEIKDTCYKGTRILLGNTKRNILNCMIDNLILENFNEISIPIIQYQETFHSKVGDENSKMMFTFKDNADRDICLAPEYTAVIQKLAKSVWKYEKDLKVFYIQECFRGEKPQEGRYRQFTQLGVEIINPTQDYNEYLINLVKELLEFNYNVPLMEFITNRDVTRGLDYYENGKGFEISCNELGAQKQICGGGSYDGGIGFAIGIDRLLLLYDK